MEAYRVAIVGATGLVGRAMAQILAERNFPLRELVAIASPRSAGKQILFKEQTVTVQAISAELFKGIDLALFSAGGATSREWAPIAASQGTIVIDNSSAWRRDPDVPLCIPEVNPRCLSKRPKGIIANPNCSTMQMLVALKPIHDHATIRRIVVSTYQAISGAGINSIDALKAQNQALLNDSDLDTQILKGQLAGNLLMHWTPDADSGYSEEELKMVFETQKIFADPGIRVSPTAVRVPVINGHAEAVAIETEKPISAAEAKALLAKAPGVELCDDFANGLYPQPCHADGRDAVMVGRIRNDIGNQSGVQMWIVADNLRKGAALNTVQIAETLIATKQIEPAA